MAPDGDDHAGAAERVEVMPVIREWLRRLWGTFRKAPEDAVMEEELRLHLEMVAADLQRRGVTPEEALRQARLQAGGIAQAMEQRRDQRGLPWLEDLLQDARFGARMLRRAPLVTAVALLTLTLAIGANSAIFSLVDSLLFRDLPVRDPASLVQFTFQYPRDPPLNIFSLADYEQYRDGNHVFSDLFGLAPLTTGSRTGEDPIGAEVVTGNFFQALGVRPALGRLLDISDDKPGAAAVAVVSWRYWKSRFNGDQRVLGSAIDIEDTRVPAPMHVTVIGVAPPGFSGIVVGYRPDVWISLSAVPDAMRSRAGLALAARLKPGASIEQARAELRVLDRARIDALAQRDPQWLGVVIDVTPARTGLSTPLHQQFGGPLLLLMTMVGGVLLLACVNIGSLLLARGAARQHEMAGTRLARRWPLPHRTAGPDRIVAPRRDGRRPGYRRRAIRRHDADADHDVGYAIARSSAASGRSTRCAGAHVHGRRHRAGGAPLRAHARDRGVRVRPGAGAAAERCRAAAIPARLRQRTRRRAGGDLSGAPERGAAVHRTSAPPA